MKRAAVARSSSTKKEESIYCTATHIRVRAQSIAATSFEISKEAQTHKSISTSAKRTHRDRIPDTAGDQTSGEETAVIRWCYDDIEKQAQSAVKQYYAFSTLLFIIEGRDSYG